MDWFLYDNGFRHETVNRINFQFPSNHQGFLMTSKEMKVREVLTFLKSLKIKMEKS